MANRSYLNPEDELLDEESRPYSSISSRGPLEGLSGNIGSQPSGANPMIRDRILKRSADAKLSNPLVEKRDPRVEQAANALSNDPFMKQFDESQSKLDDYRKVKNESDYIQNMGLALSQVAQGVNKPTQNTQLYANLQRQKEDEMKATGEDADRRSKVITAIEGRKAREAAAANAAADRREARLSREQMAALARGDRNAVREEKANEKELGLAVPGYERTGQVLPKAEEAAKFRKATATANQLSSKLNRMKELVGEVGSFEYGGEKGQEMESLATEIQLLSKNQDMYDLGVLTGPDMGLLTKITADPASFQSLMTRDSTRKKQIETQLNSIQNKLDSTGASLGYKKAPGLSSEQEKSLGENIPARIQAPDGSIRLVPRDKVDAALRAGGKRVG